MVVLGQFEYVDGVRVNGVAIRNQSGQWSGLQDSDSNVIGVGDGNRILATSALGVKDDLIVGGWFTKAGGKSIKGVTKWDADAQTFNSVPSDGFLFLLFLFFFFFIFKKKRFYFSPDIFWLDKILCKIMTRC